jgi:hypothetical protein
VWSSHLVHFFFYGERITYAVLAVIVGVIATGVRSRSPTPTPSRTQPEPSQPGPIARDRRRPDIYRGCAGSGRIVQQHTSEGALAARSQSRLPQQSRSGRVPIRPTGPVVGHGFIDGAAVTCSQRRVITP